MLTPESVQQYQAESNQRAGYCAQCGTQLAPVECHVCSKCEIKLTMKEWVFFETGKEMREEDEDDG